MTLLTFLFTKETDVSTAQSNQSFIYSHSFSFSGHQQVVPQFGTCPVNVKYCKMTELLQNHSARHNDQSDN